MHNRRAPRLHAHASALPCHPDAQPRQAPPADGIVITPSHNPPEDGGFKYNPPNGGPADTTATKWIENRANEIIAAGLKASTHLFPRPLAPTTNRHDYISEYVNDLGNVIDFDVLAAPISI